jgi:hypothetical protein
MDREKDQLDSQRNHPLEVTFINIIASEILGMSARDERI